MFSVKAVQHLTAGLQGYLDPGSGSLLLQLALGAILGVGIFVRLQWARIKKWFGSKPAGPDENRNKDGSD